MAKRKTPEIELVETWKYSRDPDTCTFLPPYEKDGVFYVPKVPTVRAGTPEHPVWIVGFEELMSWVLVWPRLDEDDEMPELR